MRRETPAGGTITGILRIMDKLIEARFTLCLPLRSAQRPPIVFAVQER